MRKVLVVAGPHKGQIAHVESGVRVFGMMSHKPELIDFLVRPADTAPVRAVAYRYEVHRLLVEGAPFYVGLPEGSNETPTVAAFCFLWGLALKNAGDTG